MLSNAISAVNQCEENEKSQLTISFDYGSKFFSISVINSAPDGYIIPDKKKRTPSFDRNHGYGMNKMRDICEKYNGDFEQTMEDNQITTTVYLPL